MNGLQREPGVPVCITGMHRSGTSSTTQILYRCGVYLGEEGELYRPQADNPDGYWENRNFVSMNERILEAFMSGWDFPPSLTEEDWKDTEKLGFLKEEATNLVSRFRRHPGPWGWKDPRSSVTMPFWLDLVPDAMTVVCLRNPLEVALSLKKRSSASFAFGLNLWMAYSRMLLDALPEGQYIVTHYGAYFYRPQDEIRRVLDFLGIPASEQLIAQARSTSLKGLRHHSITTEELRDVAVAPSGMYELYTRMCREADFEPDNPAPVSGSPLSEKLATDRI